MLGVMLDSQVEEDANCFFGVYVYDREFNDLCVYIYDESLKPHFDIEPLDLLKDTDFSSPFYIH